ncbi:MAG: GNAT family N-acetyltransferase [Actinomycetota bacterium]
MTAHAHQTVNIVAPKLGLELSCRAVLDALPEWFCIAEANDRYVAFVAAHPTWSAVDEAGHVVGLLAPLGHAESDEIYLIAVLPEWHRHGVGRALVAAFEAHSAARGLRLVQVKTLGSSNPDEGYARTRRFYTALGYLELEEMLDLWPGDPAAIMVKPLPEPSGEAAVITRTGVPITTGAIIAALQSVGVREGSVVVVHSSLSRIGWVAGDAQAVVEALLAVVGAEGTIVMPAHTGLSDPAAWLNPPVPEAWCAMIRDAAPAFDTALTPMRGMGQVVECFRRLPEVRHSGHPAVGFVARGPAADLIVRQHPLEHALDDRSPLGRLYELDARIVLFGVGHDSNTALHLAEHRATYAGKRTVQQGVPAAVDGVRRWVTYEDLDRGDDGDFPEIGAAFAAGGGDELRVQLGVGEVISCSLRDIVDFAVGWMEESRTVPE